MLTNLEVGTNNIRIELYLDLYFIRIRSRLNCRLVIIEQKQLNFFFQFIQRLQRKIDNNFANQFLIVQLKMFNSSKMYISRATKKYK